MPRVTIPVVAALAALLAAAKGADTNSDSPFEVKDEAGHAVKLQSLEAYRDEFRYLRTVFHKTDLSGPAVRTDGWNYNIAAAEWPLMGFSYFGYACADFAKLDATMRDEALAEMRWLIEALQTPRMSGFVTPHFGAPFDPQQIHVSVFVHGHFLNLATRYREVSGDERYDLLIERVAKALTHEYMATGQGILPSYRDMWWITDNFPALSALSRYDRLFSQDTSAPRKKFLNNLKTYYLDKNTGMFCTYIVPSSHRQLQGPRGISIMYGLHFLKDFDSGFAAEQFSLAKQHLLQSVLGMTAVREFPQSVKDHGDIDSGPLIFGAGPSASGFAIAAAAINGDLATAHELLNSATLVGMPVLRNGELQYLSMPTVGQAVVLFGKMELLRLDTRPAATNHGSMAADKR